MTDPELLKLARQARNALWVIAACSMIVAFAAAVAVLPPLRAIIDWVFRDATHFAMALFLVVPAAVVAYAIWAVVTEPAAQEATPGDAAPAGRQ